jgi:hypothetical protein
MRKVSSGVRSLEHKLAVIQQFWYFRSVEHELTVRMVTSSIRTGVEHGLCRDDSYWYKEKRCIT